MKTYLSSIFPEVLDINPLELEILYLTRDTINGINKATYVPVFGPLS